MNTGYTDVFRSIVYRPKPISIPISFRHSFASVRASSSTAFVSSDELAFLETTPFVSLESAPSMLCDLSDATDVHDVGVFLGIATISHRIEWKWNRCAFTDRFTASAMSSEPLSVGSMST